MGINNVHYLNINSQASTDRSERMSRNIRTNAIREIIREHKKVSQDGYYLDVDSIPVHDRKIILSHILDAYEYKWAVENDIRFEEVFNEEKGYIQKLINENIDSVYYDDMYEKDLISIKNSNNGEIIFARR